MTNLLKKYGLEPAEETEAASPFDREFFLVQCTGFVGLAYRNADGKWCAALDHHELPKDVWVVE
jgi:hypothetical protein